MVHKYYEKSKEAAFQVKFNMKYKKKVVKTNNENVEEKTMENKSSKTKMFFEICKRTNHISGDCYLKGKPQCWCEKCWCEKCLVILEKIVAPRKMKKSQNSVKKIIMRQFFEIFGMQLMERTLAKMVGDMGTNNSKF